MVEVLAPQLNISTCCKKPTILLYVKSEVIGAFGGGGVLAPQPKMSTSRKKTYKIFP
jgi:hypothetical protein